MVNTLANTLEVVEAKTLGELLGVVEGEARFHTRPDTLADVYAKALVHLLADTQVGVHAKTFRDTMGDAC